MLSSSEGALGGICILLSWDHRQRQLLARAPPTPGGDFWRRSSIESCCILWHLKIDSGVLVQPGLLRYLHNSGWNNLGRKQHICPPRSPGPQRLTDEWKQRLADIRSKTTKSTCSLKGPFISISVYSLSIFTLLPVSPRLKLNENSVKSQHSPALSSH